MTQRKMVTEAIYEENKQCIKMKTFEDFKLDESKKINPKKQFGMTTQVQDSIKKLCESKLHPEAKKYHEDNDKSHTYEKYVEDCNSFMKECMNEFNMTPTVHIGRPKNMGGDAKTKLVK